MSWKAPIINSNPDKQKVNHRVEIIDVNNIISTTENVVKIPNQRFVCLKCNEGWTFSTRIKSVECCGITYINA